jgi:pantoate--beta-alanine ligase
MQIVSSIAAMQRLAQKWRRAGIKIGFVPTMGYLHAGHLSLVKRARQAVGKTGKVVVSIYVNPTQFAPTEDLSKYPRDLKRDLKLLREVGADLVFTPSDAEMYPWWGERPREPSSTLAPPVSAPTSARKNCRKAWKARRALRIFAA